MAKDWTLDSDDTAGGVTLNSTTITLGGRQDPYTKIAKLTDIWEKEAKPEIG